MAGFEDPRLAKWQSDLSVDSLIQIEAVTEVIEGWPNVIVYCFNNNITIDGFTRRCPPDAFEIDATVSFNTTDYKYEGIKSEEISGYLLELRANFHHIHFKDQIQIVDKNEALDAVNVLREAVRREQLEKTVFNLPSRNPGLTWAGLANITLVVLACIGILVCYNTFSNHHIQKRRHRGVIEAVKKEIAQSSLYNSSVYQTIADREEHIPKTPKRASSTQVNVYISPNTNTKV